MKSPRILIAGVGNVLLGDDGFGVAVACCLAGRAMPEEVRVVDFGIRGMDLSYALLDGYETVILVDAMPRGGEPGTVYLLEPTLESNSTTPCLTSSHDMNPMNVLRLVESMGGLVGKLFVVGAEPRPLADEFDLQMELSPPMQAAVTEAVRLIESLLDDLLGQAPQSKLDRTAH